MSIVVGKVVGIKGEVLVLDTETQEVRVLSEGSELFLNEVVLTQEGATVAIETVDGNTLSIGSDSQFVIDNDVVPVEAFQELPEQLVGNFDSLQRAIVEGRFESVDGTEVPLAAEQQAAFQTQAEAINQSNNTEEELSSSNQQGVEDERNAETGEVTAGFVTDTREIDFEENVELADRATEELVIPTPEPTPEPTDPPTEPPTEEPTPEPTEPPTEAPTPEPTEPPTEAPTPEPTELPTEAPTLEPTEPPTEAPTPEPTEPPTEAPTPEPTLPPPPPRTIIKVVAADEQGNPLKDQEGNYLEANEAAEGGRTYYIALAFAPNSTLFNDNTRLETQAGTVDFAFTDDSATRNSDQEPAEGSNDYLQQETLEGIALNTRVSADALDDYISDNGELFNVTISNYQSPSPATYAAVSVREEGVETTITDNSIDNESEVPNDPTDPNDLNDGDEPNNPDDGDENTPPTNAEPVVIKLIALDGNGEPILDPQTGEYTFANQVNEGSDAKYMALAFTPGETVFSPDTKLDNQLGTINITFGADGDSATGAEEQTAADGSEDYDKSSQVSVSLGSVISTASFPDIIRDNEETYKVMVDQGSYTRPTPTSGYEDVVIDQAPVTTTILDNEQNVFVKIINNDTQAESNFLSHTLQLVDAEGNPITVANGETITVTLSYAGNGDDPAEANDYVADTEVTIVGGTSETTFYNEALDDYLAENDEQYTVTIDAVSQANNTYENVAIHTLANGAQSDAISVTGTITDNDARNNLPPVEEGQDPGQPSNPEPTEPTDPDTPNEEDSVDNTPRFGPEDTVYVRILEDDLVAESEWLSHRVQLVDQNGNPVEVPAGEIITVNLTYAQPENSRAIKQDDGVTDADYIATETVTITGETSETTFTNESLEDYFAEGAESYTITIASVTQQAGSFENIEPEVDGNGDPLEVTGTINDNPAQDTENPDTPVEPTDPDDPTDSEDPVDNTERYGPEDSVYVKITHNDTQAESNFLSHTVQLVDANDDPVIVADGETITVSLTYAGSGDDHAEDNDYVATETVTIVGGTSETTFYNEALDDYFAENDEQYTVTISAAEQDKDTYENLAVDTANNSVTGTITDNPARDSDTPNDPTEPTDPDDPTDPNDPEDSTPVYGPEDTVYVQILDNDTEQEGDSLTHKLKLVDQNGVAVNIPDGETITVTLTYTPAETDGATKQADGVQNPDYVATETVELIGTGNKSEFTFNNASNIDFLNENDESYTITINTITQANGTFENIVAAKDGNKPYEGNPMSVTGTITNGMTTDTPDNAYVDEDDFDAADANSSLTGTKDDDAGAADPDGNSSSGADTLLNIITGLDNSEYAFTFENSVVLSSEDNTNYTQPTSGGLALQYVTNGNTFTAYKGAGRTDADKVFDIVLSNNTNDDGSDDGYVYTQYQNIDHPIADNANDPATSDDTLTLTFGYKVVGTNGNTNESAVKNFTVTVNDSLPAGSNQTVSVNEDNDKLIVISAEPFANGEIEIDNNKDGPSTVASGNSIDIYDADGNDLIGSVTNHGNGTVTFSPETHFSGQASFDYLVSDRDDDTASATVTINVLPIADGVTMQADKTGNDAIVAVEDNSNTNDSPTHTQTNFAIGLGLTLSTVVDASDETTTGTTTYDSIERQGLLDFVFDNADGTNDGYLVGLDTDGDGTLDTTLFTLGTGNDGNSFSIYITDGDFHPTDLDNTGAIQLTQAEYAQLAISPIEDSHHNVVFTVTTESHEVTDAGALLSPDVISTTSTQNVTVDLQAMTDPVTIDLAVVNTVDTSVTLEDKQLADGSAGSDGHNDHINLTINEDTNDGRSYVNLKDIILERYGDIDGSENFKFEIWSEANDGVKISVEGAGTKTISTTPQIFDFSSDDPYIRLDPPENFSGDLSTISIKLIALDNDTDSTVTETETSDVITLDVFVNPIADDVTLPNVETTEDTAVKLFAGLNTTDTTAGTESITQIVINDLPAGWFLKDHNGVTLITGNGTDDATIDVANVGLANVQNYSVTPPAHSSADIDLSVDVRVQDVQTVNSVLQTDTDTFNHTLNIKVTPVAEVTTPNDGSPSQTDSDGDGSNDLGLTAGHTYNAPNTALEDGDDGSATPNWFDLGIDSTNGNEFNLKDDWANQDNTDLDYDSGNVTQTDSEETFALLTFMDADGNGITGSQYKYNDGTTDHIVTDTNGRVEIPAQYLDTLQIIAPAQLSGDFKILVEAKTVDHDEDNVSQTDTEISGESYLFFTVDPVADDVTVAIKQSFGNEDSGRDANGDATDGANGIPLNVKINTDDTDGSETYTIVLSQIPDGAAIFYNGKLMEIGTGTLTEGAADQNGQWIGAGNFQLTAADADNGDGTWELTIDNFDNTADFNYIPVYNDNTDVNLLMSAQSVDGADEGDTITNLAINVKVQGVADTPTNDGTISVTIVNTDNQQQTYNAIVHEDSGSVNLTSLFVNGTPNFSSVDIAGGDGSETFFVKINLTQTQVDDGFSISGAGISQLNATTWLLNSDDFANAQLNIPANYSGEVDFNLTLQTVEDDDASGNTIGDSDIKTVDLSILVTPEAEGTVNDSATQNEDSNQELDFSFSKNGGGVNETLTGLWINTETIPDDVKLVTTGQGDLVRTSVGSDQWIELGVTNNVVETVTAVFLQDKHDNDDDYSFEFRYTVSDTTNDGTSFTDITPDGNTYDASSIDYQTATYNVTVNAVTDTTTSSLGTITDIDGDGNADVSYDANSKTVTVTDNTIFQVPIILTADDMASEGSNGQDIDGSEEILTTVEISGVPKGIDIVDGVYLGDITDANGNATETGRWRVQINEDLIINNANGETNHIQFEVGRTDYLDINQEITLEIFHQDNGSTVLSNTETFTLVIDGNNFGGTGGTIDQPMDLVVNFTPEDFIEDTDKTLDNLVSVADDDGSNNDSSKYAITITNLSGASISGMNDEGGFYSLTGEGDINAVIASLQSITLTPDANDNINTPESVDFDLVITTYGVNEHNSYAINDATLPIAPVTDQSTISITGGGIAEDSATTFIIDLNNLADEDRNILVDGKLYIQLTDNGNTENAGTNTGSFTFGDGSALPSLTSIADDTIVDQQAMPNKLPAGDYYVIDVANFDSTVQIKYTPPANQYGNEISITSYALTQEDPESSGYTTKTWLTSETATHTVSPVNDGFSGTPTMSGNEDEIALLSLNGGTLSDGSESITGAVLQDVPFGYEVYIGNNKQTGTISGEDANGNYLYDYSLNVSSTAELETVGIQRMGVANFSGTLEGVSLVIKGGESGNEGTLFSGNIDVDFNPVADSLLNMTATKTFGDEYTWVAMNLNANVKDTDGSETLSVSFTASSGAEVLDDTALFRLNGTILDGSQATFNSGTWTISGIAFDEIGNLEMLYHQYEDDIDVVVKTVDAVTGLPTDTLGDSDDSEGTFNLRLNESYTITTGDEDNVIVTGDNGVTVDAGAGNDDITGGTGNDTIIGGAGNDSIDGGNGTDTAVYSGAIDSYQFSYDFNSSELTISGAEGIDTLTNIEKLTFNGMTYILAISDGNIDVQSNNELNLIISDLDNNDTIEADGTDWIVSASTALDGTPELFSSVDAKEPDDDNTANVDESNDGVIIDGIIQGMYYETSSGMTGLTDPNGGFKFNTGDTVTFSIGGIVIGTADAGDLAAGKVFLQDLANTDRTDLEDDYVQVMAVFLQTLDSEGNTAGGIQINDSARQAFADESLNLSSMSLVDVNALLSSHGYTPVDVETAMEHVMDMLIDPRNGTGLTEDDFEPFELQDEVVTKETLEEALVSEATDSEETQVEETVPEEIADEVVDEGISDEQATDSKETAVEESVQEESTDENSLDTESADEFVDNDSDGALLVDDALMIEDSVEEDTETESESGTPDTEDLPEASDLFADANTEDELPLPEAEESEESEEEVTPAPADKPSTNSDDSVVIEDKPTVVIEESQTDF
ncbi:Ig-like domain-containing protein [Thiomicrorhabdus indica]|uniref:Ig-like domain-containing protein n=1 Tax=Thiomicrorhabdus indica TaxID=2267253 RepID=UPI002AA90CC1|nr:hypothetical protein [Thiomicrorhabdus indica]